MQAQPAATATQQMRPRPTRPRARRAAAAVIAAALALSEPLAAEGSIAETPKTCYRPLPYPDHRRYEPYDCSDSAPAAALNSVVDGAHKGLVFNTFCSDAAACDRLQTALDQVKAAIENVVLLDAPVYVNMSFVSFCGEAQRGRLSVDTDCKFVLGAASPYQLPLEDDDGIQRMYPKALARQFGYAVDEEPDIYAYFNADAQWFFPQDTNVTINQEDIVFVIAHELVHGLGFLSEWSSDESTLFPMVRTDKAVIPSLTAGDKQAPKTFLGFAESAFDRLIGTTETVDGVRMHLTEVTRQWIAAGEPLSGRPIDVAAADLSSNVTLLRVGAATKRLAETPGTLSLLDPATGEPFLLLETSFQQFVRGTSLTHVSQAKYKASQDALMVPTTRGGYEVLPPRQPVGTPPGGPGDRPSKLRPRPVGYAGRVTLPHDRLIGPGIARVLSLIGYRTVSDPNPSNRPTLPSDAGITNSARGWAVRSFPAFGATCAALAAAVASYL